MIRAYIDGDEAAFEKLLMLHKDKVRNLIFLTLGDSEFGKKLAASTNNNTVDLNQAATLAAYSFDSRTIAIDSRYLSRFPISLAKLMEERSAQFINSQPWRKDTLIKPKL